MKTHAVACLMAAVLFGLSADEPPLTEHPDIFPVVLGNRGPRNEPGTATQASEYYTRIANELKFPRNAIVDDLDQLLKYFGYADFTATELDTTPAASLLRKDPTLLAAHYFAPKTSDVSGKTDHLSWRKIVRLSAKANSDADRNGLIWMHFLSVAYVSAAELGTQNPYKSDSRNVQVILTREFAGRAADAKLDPIYFLVFDPTHGYKLDLFTETSWDAASPKLMAGVKRYHVPDSCIECHGGGTHQGMLHFFDTDYSEDRLTMGEDFGAIGVSQWHVLHEGAKDNPEERTAAMTVFRQLNDEIHQQASAVDDTSLQARAAENWLRLHGRPGGPDVNDNHVPPAERGWPATHGGAVWGPQDADFLTLATKYCYRCHGTIYYSIFDKQEVIDNWADSMRHRLLGERMPAMPLDRELSDNEVKELVKLLQALQ